MYQLASAFIARTNEVKARRCTVLPELDYDPTGQTDPLFTEEQLKEWERYEADDLLDDDVSDDWE